MASNSVDKMDMSLDQIIKLQRKEAKQSGETGGRGRGNRLRGRGAARGGRGRGRGRGAGGASSSVSRKNEGAPAGTATRGRKLGVRANLAARRLLTKARGAGGRGRGRGGTATAFQRVARNIVKRAIVQNRRAAVQNRREITANHAAGTSASANTRRLVADVRRWRNTARQLERALQQQQQQQTPSRIRLRRFNASRGVAAQQQVASPAISTVKQRLGWRRSTDTGRGAVQRGRGGFGGRGRAGQATVVKGRGTVGQMQSDLLVQNRQVAIQQQRRQQQDAYSRGRRQQRIGQNRNLGVGVTTTSVNRSPQFATQGSGRGRRGRGGNRFGSRNNDLGASFSQGSGRQSLNERFGGGAGPIVRVGNNRGGYRGRGSRQIFF